MTSQGRWTRALLSLVLALFLLAPLVLPTWVIFLLTMAWAKALAVLGVVLLVRAGLVTFGAALYYAVGAYAAGFAVKYLGLQEGLPLVGLAIVAGVTVSALLGLLIARYRGVYFGLLNLSFSMVLYAILLKTYWVTGGTDGMRVPTPAFLGARPPVGMLRPAIYYLTVVLGALLLWAGHRFATSPLGYTLRAVRDNEVRIEYMGASVRRTIYAAYVVAGGLGSVAGVLAAFSVGHISPDFSFWTQSGEFVFVAILGGTGSVFAPLVGSIAFEFIRNYAFKWSPYTWQLTLGTVLLAIIFFLPGGLWSLAERVRSRS